MKPFLATAMGAALIAGCSVGPDYEEPKPAMPAAFSHAATDAGDVSRWWKAMGDPVLTSLIERALASNLDLDIAAARLREARSLRSAAIASFLPEIDLSGSVTRNRRSENSVQGGVLPELRSTLYEAGFDASWEIDIWGGKRRSVEVGNARVAALEENARDVRVTVAAEVGREYMGYRGAQAQLAVARLGRRGQEEILELVRARFDAGMTSDLDVARAEAEVDTLEARIATLEARRERGLFRLGVLLGQWPASLAAELSAEAPIPIPAAASPAGLPADLLRRRPDIRRAERDLAGLTAEIGIAVDKMLPHVSLIGSIGLESIDSQFFFRGASQAWSIGPSLRWRIFSLPQLYAERLAADERAIAALAIYRKTVLVALEDVENALSAAAYEDVRRAALAKAAASYRRAVIQSKDLYKQGLSSFLDVLEAERSLLNIENDLAASQAQVAANRVALYKAVGGGWEVEEEE